MIDPLYQKEILRLAATAHGAGRLTNPTASASIRNPLCGDQVTIDVKLDDGRIVEIAHQTRACVLCQASAALMAAQLPGMATHDCHGGINRLKAFLAGDSETAWPKNFAAYTAFAPVVDHAARHTCVLLPFEALTRALADITQSAV